MEQWEKKKIITVCVLVLLGVLASLYERNPQPLAMGTKLVQEDYSEIAESKKIIQVYVSGEVNSPGVYEFTEGARSSDAIRRAGGFTEYADRNKVNLAKKLKDGTQVNVPIKKGTGIIKRNEEFGKRNEQHKSLVREKPKNSATVDKTSAKVNLNTATQKELETLPGIGPFVAQKILDYRAKQRFNSIEDIKKVKGIGKGKYERLRPRLEV